MSEVDYADELLMAQKAPAIGDVADLPWWVGCVLAVVSAALIGVGLGWLVEGENQIVSHVARNATFLTYVIPALFLLASAASALRSWGRGEFFKGLRILADLHQIGWSDFEEHVHEMFRRDGNSVERRGGSESEGGIDLVLRKDGKSGIVQCKALEGSVGGRGGGARPVWG